MKGIEFPVFNDDFEDRLLKCKKVSQDDILSMSPEELDVFQKKVKSTLAIGMKRVSLGGIF